MNNAKIGSIEAISIIIIGTITRLLLNYHQVLVEETATAAWIVVILITLISLLFCYLLYKCFKNFNDNDLLDVSEFLLGKPLKIIIGLLYIVYFTLTICGTLSVLGVELKITYFTKSPLAFLIIIFLLDALIVNKLGFKAIAKITTLIVPILLISIVVIFFSVSHKFQFNNLFPVLGNGPDKIIISTLSNLSSFTSLSLLFFLNPFINKKEDFKKIAFLGIIFSAIYLFLSIFLMLLVFPTSLADEGLFLMYLISRSIEYGRFFQRTEAIFTLLWIMSSLSFISVLLFYVSYIFKKITNIKNSKQILYAFIAIIFSIALIPNNLSAFLFLEKSLYRYVFIGLVFGVSFLIMVFANIKKKRMNKL